MGYQSTKFEVSRFTHYEAINGSAKCRKWGGLGWLGVLKVMGDPGRICGDIWRQKTRVSGL